MHAGLKAHQLPCSLPTANHMQTRCLSNFSNDVRCMRQSPHLRDPSHLHRSSELQPNRSWITRHVEFGCSDSSAVYHQVGRVMQQKLLNWFLHRMRSNCITERSPDNQSNGTSRLPVSSRIGQKGEPFKEVQYALKTDTTQKHTHPPRQHGFLTLSDSILCLSPTPVASPK